MWRSVNLMRVAMLELFQVVQRLGTIEELDVLRLRRRKPTYGPAQMDEVRLDRQGNRMHPDLLRQAVGLPSIARPTRRNDVRPIVRPTARERDEMVARQRLARLELRRGAAAVLAAVAIAREEEGVRHLATETAGHMNELHEPNDDRPWQRHALRAHDALHVRLDDLGLAVDHEA